MMPFATQVPDGGVKKLTANAFLWSRVLGIPFWVMLNTLSVILYKEFHVSPFVLTILIALKPITALFAAYWSCFFSGRKSNLIVANILRFSPFLLLFSFSSVWLIMLSFTIYMILSRGSMPAWTELFKSHLPDQSQSRVFALGNTLEYVGTTLFPLIIGIVLDYNALSWRWLFPVTALLGLTSTFFLLRLPSIPPTPPSSITKKMVLPWSNSLSIIKERSDFRRFLMGFMLGGAGLMVIQPVLPLFFVDELQFSYTEMMLAISVCKGIGYIIASPFWVRLFKRVSIFNFSVYVVILACCFPLLLIGAKWNFWLCYGAFLVYGYMQSGSELSWNLSPLSFSKEKESLTFSETNILAVGVRGCIIPFLGNYLFLVFNSMTVMIVGSLFCLAGAWVLTRQKKVEMQQT